MSAFIKNFTLLMLVYVLTNYQVTGESNETVLIKDLMEKYGNKYAVPGNHPVQVGFRFSPTIAVLEDSTQQLQLRGMLAVIWEDNRLSWSPPEYGNLRMIRIPLMEDHKPYIWKPELVLNESLDHDSANFNVVTDVVKLSYDGTIEWYTLAMTKTYCRVNVQHFPFDRQTCVLTFTTWQYQTTEQMFYVIDDIIKDETYMKYEVPSGVWDFNISDATAGKTSYDCLKCDNEEQSYIRFTLTFTRSNHVWYFLTYMLPCFVLSTMTTLTFWLPHREGVDASSFGLTCILTLFVFLTFLFTQLPPTSPPYMGLYIVWLILQAVFATIFVTRKAKLSLEPNKNDTTNGETFSPPGETGQSSTDLEAKGDTNDQLRDNNRQPSKVDPGKMGPIPEGGTPEGNKLEQVIDNRCHCDILCMCLGWYGRFKCPKCSKFFKYVGNFLKSIISCERILIFINIASSVIFLVVLFLWWLSLKLSYKS